MRSACRSRQFALVAGDTDLTADAGKTSASRQTFVSRQGGRARRASICASRSCGSPMPARTRRSRSTARRSSVARRRRRSRAVDLARGRPTADWARARFDPPTTPLDANGQGMPYATYGFAAQIAEVEVDLELGTVKLLRIVAAHDVGHAINPTLVEGQIHGGIAQGIGMALMEEYLPGRTENLHDYLIPTVGDVPRDRVHPDRGPRAARPLRRQGRRRAGAGRRPRRRSSAPSTTRPACACTACRCCRTALRAAIVRARSQRR